MTLMDLEQTAGEVVRFDHLRGQETKTIDWCLRGDKAGSYDLTADYSGVLKDFGANVTGQFKTSEPIKVLGLDAAKVIMKIDPEIRGGKFVTTISLKNKGDTDMYMPSIGIADDLIKIVEKYTLKGIPTTSISHISPELKSTYIEDEDGNIKILFDQYTDVLSSGQMLSKRYVCYSAIKSEDLAEFKQYCTEIAEGYGIDFELQVEGHDSYYEVPDTEELNTGFKLGEDNNSYAHAYEGDRAGFYGMYNYNVDSTSYFYLLYKASGFGQTMGMALAPDEFSGGWCPGVAATIAGVFNKDLKISDISSSKVNDYYSMEYPCNDKKLMNAINYYYLATNYYPSDSTIAYYNSYSDKYSGLTNYNDKREGDVADFFKKLKNELSKGKVVFLGIPDHAVIAVGYKKTEDGHEFIVYDENTVSGRNPKGFYQKIITNKDMSKFSWLHDGKTMTEMDCGAFTLLDSSLLVRNFPPPYANDSEITRIIKDAADTAISITLDRHDISGVFASIYLDPENFLTIESINNYTRFRGNAVINRIRQLFNDGDNRETYVFSVDSVGDNPIIIDDINGTVDITISDAAGAVAVRGSGIEEIDITLGQSVTVKGEDYTADVTVSCFDDGDETAVKLVSSEFSSTGSTTITSDPDGISITGDSTINNLTVENVTGMESIQTAENATVEPGETASFVTDEKVAVEAAKAAINALPGAEQITLDDESAIQYARAAYDKLTDEQKEKVGQAAYDKLAAAETALETVKKKETAAQNLADAVTEAENKAEVAEQKAKAAEDAAADLKTAADAAKEAADKAAETKSDADIADAKAKAEAAKEAQTAAQTAINEAVTAKSEADSAAEAAETAIAEAKAEDIDTSDAESRVSAAKNKTAQAEETTSAAEGSKNQSDSTISDAEGTVAQVEKDKDNSGSGSGGASNPSVTPGTTPQAAPAGPSEIMDLPAVKISKPKAAKKSATIRWKKVSKKNLKKIKKIEIQYSMDKSFQTGVKKKYVKAKKTSQKITKLTSKKKYYVRIRAYTSSGGVIHVSKWSKTKTVKAK